MNTQERISAYRTTSAATASGPNEDGEYLLHNRIRCTACGSIIESYHRHDFKYCKCGAVAVDGGLAYRRRLGDMWEEMSEYGTKQEETMLCKSRK